jgi:hypothetical protein
MDNTNVDDLRKENERLRQEGLAKDKRLVELDQEIEYRKQRLKKQAEIIARAKNTF